MNQNKMATVNCFEALISVDEESVPSFSKPNEEFCMVSKVSCCGCSRFKPNGEIDLPYVSCVP